MHSVRLYGLYGRQEFENECDQLRMVYSWERAGEGGRGRGRERERAGEGEGGREGGRGRGCV